MDLIGPFSPVENNAILSFGQWWFIRLEFCFDLWFIFSHRIFLKYGLLQIVYDHIPYLSCRTCFSRNCRVKFLWRSRSFRIDWSFDFVVIDKWIEFICQFISNSWAWPRPWPWDWFKTQYIICWFMNEISSSGCLTSGGLIRILVSIRWRNFNRVSF